jgi:tetratricopeptide (TPR) repeat protein
LQDCQQTQDPDLAIDGCTSVLATASGDQMIQAEFNLGRAYLIKQDFYHAVKDFTAVIGIRAVAPAYALRGSAYAGEIADDPAFADKAISDFSQALNLKPDLAATIQSGYAYAYAARAATNLANGRDAQALADEKRATELDSDKISEFNAILAQAYRTRALQRLAGGQYNLAASDLQQAIELDQTTSAELSPYLHEAQAGAAGPYTAIAKGNEHEHDGAYDLAVKDYTDAIQTNSHLAEAYLVRGYAYQALHRPDEARADFDQAIKLDPNNWTGYYGRGLLSQRLGRFDQASADFNQASTLIDQAQDANIKNKKAFIGNALKSFQFDRMLENRWISYLKQIQTSNNYGNWSSAPYDLYAERHNLPGLAPRPWSSFATWQIVLLSLFLILGAAALVQYRRRPRYAGIPGDRGASKESSPDGSVLGPGLAIPSRIKTKVADHIRTKTSIKATLPEAPSRGDARERDATPLSTSGSERHESRLIGRNEGAHHPPKSPIETSRLSSRATKPATLATTPKDKIGSYPPSRLSSREKE